MKEGPTFFGPSTGSCELLLVKPRCILARGLRICRFGRCVLFELFDLLFEFFLTLAHILADFCRIDLELEIDFPVLGLDVCKRVPIQKPTKCDEKNQGDKTQKHDISHDYSPVKSVERG